MTLEDYSKYYIQGSDHYLISKDEFVELFNEMTNWKEESVELKKQLENKYEKVGTLTAELLYKENTKLINQQKEFIKYLEDKIKKTMDTMELLSDTGSCRIPYLKSKKIVLEKILQKYKEIIGDDKQWKNDYIKYMER